MPFWNRFCFFLLVLKRLKLNCFMLQSQKCYRGTPIQTILSTVLGSSITQPSRTSYFIESYIARSSIVSRLAEAIVIVVCFLSQSCEAL